MFIGLRPCPFVGRRSLRMAQENHIADANRDLDHFIRSTPDILQWDWESRIGQFLLGKIGESDLFAAAASPVHYIAVRQRTDALYYAGMKRLLAGNKAGRICSSR